MSWTTPKTDNLAADGLDYLHLNKIEENLRVLGGSGTAPVDSTSAATANALAKRDTNGDVAFRRVAVSQAVCTAGDYVLDAWDVVSSSRALAYTAFDTRKLYCSRTGTVRVKFRFYGGLPPTYYYVYARIYKNGVAVGTERKIASTTWVEYSEDLAVTAGDYFEIFYKCDTDNTGVTGATMDRFTISVAEVL